MKEKHIVSVLWGRSGVYYPVSSPKICWDGNMQAENGKLLWLDRLNYRFLGSSQGEEISYCIHNTNLPAAFRKVGTWYKWKSDITPGDPGSMEGLRFEIEGDEDTVITIDLVPIKIQFKLGELLKREYLRYRVGNKYAGNAVDVFLGRDARKRVLRDGFLGKLTAENKAGYLIMPDDFNDATKTYHHSTYGALLDKGKVIRTEFPIVNFKELKEDVCPLRIHVVALLGYKELYRRETIVFSLKIGSYSTKVSRYYTNMLFMPRMEEICIDVPQSVLKEEGNTLELSYVDGDFPLLFHRIFVNTERISLKDQISILPPLPKVRNFHVGSENDMLTPENGDIDFQIDMFNDEQVGDFVLFRKSSASATDEQITRWCNKMKEYGFLCATCQSERPEATELMEKLMGDSYKGCMDHEISNLAYGWGDADPIEERIGRTLPECKASYLERMGASKMVGQAIPQQHLDYEAGVDVVMTEIPGVHCTLSLSSHRAAVKAYGKKHWGVHVANHVQKTPLDDDSIRRLFIVTAESWLFGAKEVSDEEVMFRYFYDTLYTYSDALPTGFRKVYQSIFHYGNAIDLGEPIVKTGFLHGNYDFIIGGTAAGPYMNSPKFWGEFGPETEGWDYDTPEAGWKLIHSFLPGAHLYPVPQKPEDIRLFFSGTPNGQVDLVPITIGAQKLSAYETLFLPGWNTMTQELYEQLIEYVRGGGHLILCATQCTTHITRQFLLEKKDFAFINDGDLSELAGVKVFAPEGIVNLVRFEDEELYTNPGVPGLLTELVGASVLATDQDNKPVLVENKIGKGKVWMLTVGEYWGHDALESLRKAICNRVVAQHPLEISIIGSDEVEYHHYRCDGFERVVLLNTDWTSSDNCKHITLLSGGLRMPLSVQEGRMRHVLIADDTAVSFEAPPSIVDEFSATAEKITFKVSGSGKVVVELFSLRKIAKACVDKKPIAMQENDLILSLGSTWNTCFVEITLF